MHIRCPHCHGPIELIDLHNREIVCPSCGSSIQLQHSTTDWRSKDGERKLGKFEILGELGVGAFGTVYRARDPELDRIVALEIPRADNPSGQKVKIVSPPHRAQSCARSLPLLVTLPSTGYTAGQ
jgi:hypothetical protein